MRGRLPRSHEDLKLASDEALMMAYKEGQEKIGKEAFMHLYERNSGKVYGFLSARLKDRAMVDDVFQATFLKLHNSRRKYDPSLPFAPWLFTICRTTMLDAIRARRKVTANETLDEVAVSEAKAPVAAEAGRLSDFGLNLGGLSVNQRQAVELRYVEDLSFEQIAARLRTTPENTRQFVSRALRKLTNLVQGEKE